MIAKNLYWQKMALQYLQRYLLLKDSGVVAPSQRCSRRRTYRDVGKSGKLMVAGMFGKVQELIGSEWIMLYGMIQYKLMRSPSRTSVLDDMLNLSL
jgi:hypothetical protein